MYMYLCCELVNFLTLHIDICKHVRQVALTAVSVASNASSCRPRFKSEAVFTFDLVTLTFDFSPSKRDHGSALPWTSFLPFSACYALPFST